MGRTVRVLILRGRMTSVIDASGGGEVISHGACGVRPGECLLHPGPALEPDAPAQIAIRKQTGGDRGDVRRGFRIHEEPGGAILHGIGHTTAAPADDRSSGGVGFEVGDAEAFEIALLLDGA